MLTQAQWTVAHGTIRTGEGQTRNERAHKHNATLGRTEPLLSRVRQTVQRQTSVTTARCTVVAYTAESITTHHVQKRTRGAARSRAIPVPRGDVKQPSGANSAFCRKEVNTDLVPSDDHSTTHVEIQLGTRASGVRVEPRAERSHTYTQVRRSDELDTDGLSLIPRPKWRDAQTAQSDGNLLTLGKRLAHHREKARHP